MFSQSHAAGLMEVLGAADPSAAARQLIFLLEGMAFDAVAGPPSDIDSPSARDTITLWLEALTAGR